ncbi:hypothetical protein D3C72_1094350 [compost metagenome]
MAIAPTTPTGRLIRKIQCQEAYSTRIPPRAGPSNGPTWPGSVTKVIAAIYCSRGTIFITVSLPTGTIIAPPTPCSTRAITSSFSVSACAQNSEPRVNRIMAVKKILRTPTLSASQPLAGNITATVST